jgi:cytidylate kinase
MVALQRRIGLRVCENAADGENGSQPCIVAEGRDTGTIVFPEALVKIFLTADIDERARRRTPDFSGTHASIEQVRKQIETRDASDTSRAVGPLRSAEDAVLIDNTDLSQHQTLQKALEIIHEKTGAAP